MSKPPTQLKETVLQEQIVANPTEPSSNNSSPQNLQLPVTRSVESSVHQDSPSSGMSPPARMHTLKEGSEPELNETDEAESKLEKK